MYDDDRIVNLRDALISKQRELDEKEWEGHSPENHLYRFQKHTRRKTDGQENIHD